MNEALRRALIGNLQRHGVRAVRARGRRPRTLESGEEMWDVGVPRHPAVRFRVTPLNVEGLGHPSAGGRTPPHLWVAEHVPAVVANRLVADDQAFVDAAGNVHLRLPGLIVHVLGKGPTQPQKRRREERATRAWRRPAIRALFRLLCEPALGERPIREIAEKSGTAVGTTVLLLRDLERTGNVMKLARGRRRFVPDRALVTRWILEYGQKLRPHQLLGRFATREPIEGFDPDTHGARWGGEPAAKLLGADLVPGIWTLYAEAKTPGLLRAAGLRPDPEGAVELRQAFWRGEIGAPRGDITPPLLVVADLLATRDGRCHAAAETIDRKYLHGLVGEG